MREAIKQTTQDSLLPQTGSLSIFSNELLKEFIDWLDIGSVVQLSHTCRFFRQLTQSERAKPQLIKEIEEFFYLFNDCFVEPPALDEFDNTELNKLLEFCSSLNKLRNTANTFSSQSTELEVIIAGLQDQCLQPAPDMEFYDAVFLEVKELVQNPPKESSSLTEKTSSSDICFSRIQLLEQIMQRHLLARLHFKKGNVFAAWWIALCTHNLASRSALKGHHSAFLASLHYLQLLNNDDYQKAIKITFCHIAPSHNPDQFIDINAREDSQILLMLFWLKLMLFHKRKDTLDTESTAKLITVFCSANKTSEFYLSINNFLTNFFVAYETYSNDMLKQFDAIMPALLKNKDLSQIIKQLNFEDMCQIDPKFWASLSKNAINTNLKEIISFIKTFNEEATNTFLGCAYPKALLYIYWYSKFQLPLTYLKFCADKLNAIYALHHKTSYRKNYDEHWLPVKTDLHHERILQAYAISFIICKLKNLKNPTASAALNNLAMYPFSCAEYIFYLNLNPDELLQLANCHQLLMYFFNQGPLPTAIKTEISILYRLRNKDKSILIEEFNRKLENLTATQISDILNSHPEDNYITIRRQTMNRFEIDRIFYIFEKNIHLIFLQNIKPTTLLARLPYAVIVETYESKLNADESYFDKCKNFSPQLQNCLVKEYFAVKDIQYLKYYISHPLTHKIAALPASAQNVWLKLFLHFEFGYLNTYSRKNSDIFGAYLTFSEALNDISLSTNQSSLLRFLLTLEIEKENFLSGLLAYLDPFEPETCAMNMQVLADINRELLDKIDWEQIKQLYATFEELFTKFNHQDSFEEIETNLHFICEYIKKFGYAQLILRVEKTQSVESPEIIYETLVEEYSTAATTNALAR